jgi:hypothetical protein
MTSKNYTIDDIIEQIFCYIKNCNVEYEEINILKNKVLNANKIVIDAYKNKNNDKKLTKQEFIDKMMQIRKIQFDSETFTKFSKCSLKNCYSINVKILDNILEELSNNYNIKYKKPAKYTLKDYKNILLMYIKVKEIMPIANSQ